MNRYLNISNVKFLLCKRRVPGHLYLVMLGVLLFLFLCQPAARAATTTGNSGISVSGFNIRAQTSLEVAASAAPSLRFGVPDDRTIWFTENKYAANGSLISYQKYYPFYVKEGSGDTTVTVELSRLLTNSKYEGVSSFNSTFHFIEGHKYYFIVSANVNNPHPGNYSYSYYERYTISSSNMSQPYVDNCTNTYLSTMTGFTIRDYDTPQADFSITPEIAGVGEDIQFDASASTDPNNGISEYNWDFGDGSLGTGKKVSHSYTRAASYPVLLTVKNQKGLQDSSMKTIIVENSGQQVDKNIELLHTLSGHTDGVHPVAFSPNSQILATGSYDKTIKLWQVTDGSLLRTLTGHSDTIYGIAFSPDGQTLASVSMDKSIKIWRVSDGTLIKSISNAHEDVLRAVVFSPDGKLLASASLDKTIKLWNSSDYSLAHTLQGHLDGIYGLAFSPDGQTLASASVDKSIKIWRISDDTLLRSIEDAHSDAVRAVAFSPDGQTLASGSYDKSIKLWKVTDGSPLRTLNLHTGVVYSVAFSPDGQLLASVSADKSVRVWQLKKDCLNDILGDHSDIIYSVAISKDGKMLASGSADKTAKLWSIPAGPAEQLPAEQLPAKQDQLASKDWTIRLNQVVDQSTVNENTVYVMNSQNQKVSVSVTTGSDGKSVLVKHPASGYTAGSYTLNVTTGVKTTANKALKQAYQMLFTIKESTPVPPFTLESSAYKAGQNIPMKYANKICQLWCRGTEY